MQVCPLLRRRHSQKRRKRARNGRRLGKDNRQTDVQRIGGETTDERISTDLDCIKNRLWGVQSVNLFWPILFTHSFYTCITVSLTVLSTVLSHGSKLLQTKQGPHWKNFNEEESSQVILFLLVCDLNLPQSSLWPDWSLSRLHHPHHLPGWFFQWSVISFHLISS